MAARPNWMTDRGALVLQPAYFGERCADRDGYGLCLYGCTLYLPSPNPDAIPSAVHKAGFYHSGARRLGLKVLILFDTRDADTTYFYQSRLQAEASGIEGGHFHPVEPRSSGRAAADLRNLAFQLLNISDQKAITTSPMQARA
ncbi:hypothetical protein [Erythrobacter sp. R86502]|uniref:hypothetical protein n=1 Tax=Erythrobacter sp. R86502 TaxID=3093846 RepID=UPI0036D315F5